MPAVDVVENEKTYEVTAELPGMDEKNIEVKVANGVLTTKVRSRSKKRTKRGEKEGLLPAGTSLRFIRAELPGTGELDPDKIEATFTKGVLAVTLPKKADAQRPAKKVKVTA
jgi:HSP20 family protein